MSKLTCYVASPYGFAESTREFYAKKLLPTLSKYVEVKDPWSVDASHILKMNPSEQPAGWVKLGEHHLKTVESVDLVVACLDQEPPDNGTVIELAWAAAHKIPVIGYRGDFRSSGEDGMRYNLMIGAAIKESGGVEVSNLKELELALKTFVKA